jgi:hypothetical protein
MRFDAAWRGTPRPSLRPGDGPAPLRPRAATRRAQRSGHRRCLGLQAPDSTASQASDAQGRRPSPRITRAYRAAPERSPRGGATTHRSSSSRSDRVVLCLGNVLQGHLGRSIAHFTSASAKRHSPPTRASSSSEPHDLGSAEIASQRREIDAFTAPKNGDLQDIRSEPERGLEPLTFRLQGECSTS